MLQQQAISSENNCALKVAVTTSTREPLTARPISSLEIKQINGLRPTRLFSRIRKYEAFFLPDSFSRLTKFTEDENWSNFNKRGFNVNWPLSSSPDPALCPFCFSSFSCRSSIPAPLPLPFLPPSQLSISIHKPQHESPGQSSPPSICTLYERGHLTSQSPLELLPFFSPSHPISASLACPLPVFLLPCTSWDNIIQRTGLWRPKAPTRSPSIPPLSFNHFSASFSVGQWLQPSDWRLCHAN